MERRKVQLTGGSTFTVSLPKEWARNNDIDAGDELRVYEDGPALHLTTGQEGESTEGHLEISELDGDALTRAVVTLYVSGFDVMVLEADRITAEKRRRIRTATQSLVGLEVLEETGTEVVIQDLLDSSELSISSAVHRMRLIATSMVEDAIEALLTDDDDIAADVVGRDDDVDRLWFMVARTFRGTLQSPQATQSVELDRVSCFDFHTAARQLERVADHAAKIADVAADQGPVSESINSEVRTLCEVALNVVDTSMDALTADEEADPTRLANEAHEAVEDVDRQARDVDAAIRAASVEPAVARDLGLVVDSLSRIGDYGGNIAETALQQAAPRPHS